MEDKKGELTINIKSLVLIFAGLTLGLVIGWLVNESYGSDSGEERKITVDGSAEVSAAPDESLFYASYEEKNSDRTLARETIVSKGETIVGELKKLGVEEKQITSDISTYENYNYNCINCEDNIDGFIASNNLQIEINDSDLAEKVYNYLLTTDIVGRVTPNSSFSSEKEKQLKVDARKLAVADAKQQAGQLAEELDADLGKVISVEEKQGFDFYYGGYINDAITSEYSQGDSEEAAQLLTGEQDLTFSVEVQFELK